MRRSWVAVLAAVHVALRRNTSSALILIFASGMAVWRRERNLSHTHQPKRAQVEPLNVRGRRGHRAGNAEYETIVKGVGGKWRVWLGGGVVKRKSARVQPWPAPHSHTGTHKQKTHNTHATWATDPPISGSSIDNLHISHGAMPKHWDINLIETVQSKLVFGFPPKYGAAASSRIGFSFYDAVCLTFGAVYLVPSPVRFARNLRSC